MFKLESFPSENYELVYSLDSSWKVVNSSCEITFKEFYDCEDIDYVFCGLIHSHGGKIKRTDLGELLGFSLIEEPESNKFRDEAEEKIFENFLDELKLFGLIEIGDNTENKDYILITGRGESLLENKKKFRIWTSPYNYTKHHYSCEEQEWDYFKNLNLTKSQLEKRPGTIKSISCDVNNRYDYYLIQNKLNFEDNERYELLTIKNPKRIESKDIPIKCNLLQHKEQKTYFLIIYKDEVIDEQFTHIVNSRVNHPHKTSIIKQCQFNLLLEDKNALIGRNEVERFLGFWLISDL